jgi:hypothetical protein
MGGVAVMVLVGAGFSGAVRTGVDESGSDISSRMRAAREVDEREEIVVMFAASGIDAVSVPGSGTSAPVASR